MKKYILAIVVCGYSFLVGAMEPGKKLDLVIFAAARPESIQLVDTLADAGSPSMQRNAIQSFAKSLPEVITPREDGNFNVNVKDFRRLLISTGAALPAEQLDLKGSIVGVLLQQGKRTYQNMAGMGKLALVGVGVAAIFYSGVIYGWWKTKEMHGHGGGGN
ncbi:MAG: hypothetical protein AB7F19_01145 [Candidatus Babeliales bacterium]